MPRRVKTRVHYHSHSNRKTSIEQYTTQLIKKKINQAIKLLLPKNPSNTQATNRSFRQHVKRSRPLRPAGRPTYRMTKLEKLKDMMDGLYIRQHELQEEITKYEKLSTLLANGGQLDEDNLYPDKRKEWYNFPLKTFEDVVSHMEKLHNKIFDAYLQISKLNHELMKAVEENE